MAGIAVIMITMTFSANQSLTAEGFSALPEAWAWQVFGEVTIDGDPVATALVAREGKYLAKEEIQQLKVEVAAAVESAKVTVLVESAESELIKIAVKSHPLRQGLSILLFAP